jgi:hypothetical protein
VFRRAFTLAFGLVTFLRRLHRVGLRFLAVSGDLTAKPLPLTFLLAAPFLDRPSGHEQQKREHNYDGDHDGDYGNR